MIGLGAAAAPSAAAGAQVDPEAGRYAGLLAEFDRVFRLEIRLGDGWSYELAAEREGLPSLDPAWAARVGLGAGPPAGASDPPAAPEGGGCSVTATHTAFDFDSGGQQQVILQAGIAEQEVAAASYAVPSIDFPIRFESGEIVWGTQSASVPTTTQFTFNIYDGLPTNNFIVESFSSDGEIIPPIELPVGTNAVVVQVLGDPGDPIFVNNLNGDDAYAVGWRIDQHNNQTQNPCFVGPPPASNAFPATDVDGVLAPTGNWVNAISCGPFGCPPNGGWFNFTFLPGLCAPSGDWIIRSSYFSFGCNPTTGACCIENGFTCEQLSFNDCAAAGGEFAGVDTLCEDDVCPFGACCFEATGGCLFLSVGQCDGFGVYQGDGVACEDAVCAIGACCLPDAACADEIGEQDCEALGGTFQGHDADCAGIDCPETPEACCFPATGGCLDLTPTDCTGAGGAPGGVGSSCAAFVCFPEGACCLPDGACAGPISPDDCAGLAGVFQGDATDCAAVECPLPQGACCFDTGFCLDLVEADCVVAGADWQGPGTDCAAGCTAGCDEDLTGDGSIDSQDLNQLLAAFGASDDGDVDGDADTDSGDLNLLLAAFGGDCR